MKYTCFKREKLWYVGEVYVAFADDVVSDTQTETDVRQLEGKHKMTIQQMKEHILGSVSTTARRGLHKWDGC